MRYVKDAVAIVDGPESLQKIVSCNKKARDIGIQEGMTKNQATIRNIIVRRRIVRQEKAIHSEIMDCGYSISPYLEPTCLGTIIIGLTRSQRFLESRISIGQQLIARANECGIKVHVAFATNPDTALFAARGFPGITVIKPGQEALRIAPLPIEVLRLEPETVATLGNWGIRDLYSLSKLPIGPLAQRFGQRGFYLQQLALGEVNRKLIAVEQVARFRETIELDDAVELLDPLLVLLERLLQRLISRLKMRSLATDQIQINLEVDHHPDRQLNTHRVIAPVTSFQKTVKIPVPTQEAGILLKLLQFELAEHPPEAPVKKVTMEAFPASIRFAQAGIFEPRAPEPAKLEVTMARLRTVVGERDECSRNLVGFAKAKDSHKPDTFEVQSSHWNADSKKERGRNAPKLALRVFRPPLRAKVELKGNIPSAVIYQGRRRTVSRVSGPWHTSGAWWDKAEEWNRSEWDVQVSGDGCGLYRIFCDHESEQWFVDGTYD